MQDNDVRSLLIFGGKGGCGKTTTACATGIYLSNHYPEKKILIVSCDPAHSVGDSFNYPVGNRITQLDDQKNLFLLEINSEEEASEFKRKYGSVIKKIAERGTYFDKNDIENFFSLSIPGLDEVMAIIRIANILKEKKFDLILLDTAPTGHTIRLLGLPDEMRKLINVIVLMQSKHKFLSILFSGKHRKDEADEFLEMMEKDVDDIKNLLMNNNLTEFIPVLRPEAMAIEETERLLETLKNYKIKVESIVVNQLVSAKITCRFCSMKMEEQKKELVVIEQKFSKFKLRYVPMFPHQITGADRLREYCDVLFNRKTPSFSVKNEFYPVVELKDEKIKIINGDIMLYIFGGKGGVGKTTVTSATAISIAKKYRHKKVLIISTDPANSLSDIFEIPIGDNLTQIGGMIKGMSDHVSRGTSGSVPDNLFALEIDAQRLLDDYKKDYRNEINEIFDKFVGENVDIKFDREIFEGLFSLTPPGLDEIMALMNIIEFMKQKKFDIYVIDSSATGHLLRFLEMPRIAREWVNAIFKLLIKYKGVIRLDELGRKMIEFSKNVKKVQELLTDSTRSKFVVITIPEVMGKNEMDDLLDKLAKLNMQCRDIIINMVFPETGCDFCESKRKEQSKIIHNIEKERDAKYRISRLQISPYEIKGINRLDELSTRID